MITTSHKPQAKRITTNSCPSSVESTNLKKRITMGPGELTESLFFLLIKSLKQQARKKKASSNKQQASSPVTT